MIRGEGRSVIREGEEGDKRRGGDERKGGDKRREEGDKRRGGG